MRSFLQTKTWLEFQEAIGHKTWRFDDGEMKANIIQHRLPFKRSYLYIPHGPTLDLSEIKSGLKNEVKRFMDQLVALAIQEKAMFIKVEPLEDAVMELVYRRGFKVSRKQTQPYRTVILDLNKPEQELLSSMHHKTRYNINLAQKKGLIVKESKNIDGFLGLLKKTAKADNFHIHSEEHYKKMMEFFSHGKELEVRLFMVFLGERAIGGEIIMLYGQDAYYLHGAMDREYKSMMAPYLMHWEIIKWLKQHNFKTYDFWGIDAQKWPGLTRFKTGWGGRLVEYPGSFDYPIRRFWYLVYRLVRRVIHKF